MGVMRVPGTEGATMGPPADRLYAVDPEGVATINPSACRNSIPVNNYYHIIEEVTSSESYQMLSLSGCSINACLPKNVIK